jgi:FtsH-binding integral membrane protein
VTIIRELGDTRRHRTTPKGLCLCIAVSAVCAWLALKIPVLVVAYGCAGVLLWIGDIVTKRRER